MTSTWNDLATSARWRGVVAFIRNWVGSFDADRGMAADKLDRILRVKPLELPAAVREWYLLAANWNQGGLNAWIRPHALTACDGMVGILTDTEGINLWGVRVADLDTDDPPIVSRAIDPSRIAFPSFTMFVAAMIVNDVLFDYKTEAPVELNRDSARTDFMCLVTSSCGVFFTDAPLESATVVVFAYPENGPVLGKSRTADGRSLLERLRLSTV